MARSRPKKHSVELSFDTFPMKGVVDEITQGNSIPDYLFDLLYPEGIRAKSQRHWTPVSVAMRAAQLLDVGPKTKILDIGSGAGKFCLVGSLTTKRNFVGVEQRPNLVKVAEEVSHRLGLTTVKFVNALAYELPWSEFTGFYLYNPFVEHLYQREDRIDDTLSDGSKPFLDHVLKVQTRLSMMPAKTRVVTFHGFGGALPKSYLQIEQERAGDDYLILWEKKD